MTTIDNTIKTVSRFSEKFFVNAHLDRLLVLFSERNTADTLTSIKKNGTKCTEPCIFDPATGDTIKLSEDSLRTQMQGHVPSALSPEEAGLVATTEMVRKMLKNEYRDRLYSCIQEFLTDEFPDWMLYSCIADYGLFDDTFDTVVILNNHEKEHLIIGLDVNRQMLGMGSLTQQNMDKLRRKITDFVKKKEVKE